MGYITYCYDCGHFEADYDKQLAEDTKRQHKMKHSNHRVILIKRPNEYIEELRQKIKENPSVIYSNIPSFYKTEAKIKVNKKERERDLKRKNLDWGTHDPFSEKSVSIKVKNL